MFSSLNYWSSFVNCVNFQNPTKDEMEKPDLTSSLDRLRQDLQQKDEENGLLCQELQAEKAKNENRPQMDHQKVHKYWLISKDAGIV